MRRLVLIGGGHAHLEVLRQAAVRRFAKSELLLLSPFVHHHYSGMVPGFLQGTYVERELAFDLPALCRAAGAEFREAYADRVDPAGRWVEVDGARVECDLVSADVGSAPAGLDGVPGAREHAFTVRPMTRAVALEQRIDELVSTLANGSAAPHSAVCVVGGGAAGVEVTLAVRRRLDDAGCAAMVTLVDRATSLLAEYAPAVGHTIERLFAARRIVLRSGHIAARVTGDSVVLNGGDVVPATLAIWLTGAAPTALTAASDLAKDERGFWLVDDTLRAAGGGAVWGGGDCVTMRDHRWVSKAGVYAVRQGPVLAANLRQAAECGPGEPGRAARYAPQRHFLAILNTADDRALLRWRGVTAHARWAWWLKDAIDRRFMAKYQVRDAGGAAPPASTPAGGASAGKRTHDDVATDRVADDGWTTSVATLQRATPGAVTVIDVRSALAYRRGHLPGAVRVSWLSYRDGWGRTGTLPEDLDGVARALAASGVDVKRPVVVYGKAREGWGEEGRVAWMLHYLGHPRVTILDGGWPAWQRAGGAETRHAPEPHAGHFTARLRPEARASADDVARAAAAGIAILDTRSEAEWNGSRKYWPKRTGHIPGAVHLEWRDLLTPAGLIDRSPALRTRLARLGLTPDRPVIAYCVGGVRSGETFMVLRALGFRDVRNYDGSWYEWADDERRPIVSGGDDAVGTPTDQRDRASLTSDEATIPRGRPSARGVARTRGRA